MLRNFACLILVSTFCACNNGSSSDKPATDSVEKNDAVMLTEEQKAEGWKLLFDGKTTNGWHKYGGGPTGSAWKVADGMLYLDTSVKENWQIKDGGDIVTDDEYDNFHLKLEWKIAKDGNSGVIFYIHEDSAKYTWAWETGPEMQVLDNEGHPDAKIEKHRAGDLYDLISCSKETVRPAGEWNQVEVIADNGRLDFFLNNENVVSTTMWDDNWRKMIAGSKFADMPDFGTFKKGRIGLQDHGNMVWFKNVMIKKL
ncbi:MAG TPA: DUF1080 domain-containing protein [Chitinophagaceae bacterium]|nr:DUF1080 domain-containing protein [Chitinophagaceae bacterium]HPG12255.1 DUF1080 domain-containing protein [Chitinophagaceae bacterium]HRX94663.1 DUF1080 domain-containing protein [Chitinophagaceae bacterium]